MCRDIRFSLASIATVSACIFLFCIFYSIVTNIRHIENNIETNVGIMIFFEESATDEDIESIGEAIRARGEVTSVEYISAEEAWESFKEEYFADDEELAAGFAGDNPLADSASYKVLLASMDRQQDFVAYVEELDGVRFVNYSSDIVSELGNIRYIFSIISGGIIALLLAIAIFLIGNSIHMSARLRSRENEIMRLIGATNFMIRFPFVLEGTFIGLIGAGISLGIISFIYANFSGWLISKVGSVSSLLSMIPFYEIFPQMAGISLLLGCGVGFVASYFTIRKVLRV